MKTTTTILSPHHVMMNQSISQHDDHDDRRTQSRRLRLAIMMMMVLTLLTIPLVDALPLRDLHHYHGRSLPPTTVVRHHHGWSTTLYYKDERNIDHHHDDLDDMNQPGPNEVSPLSSPSFLTSPTSWFPPPRASPSVNKKESATTTTLPLLGPFINHVPLIPGQEMILSSPTPMQWRTIQEAYAVHQREQQQHLPSGASSSSQQHHQSPLMLLLDETNRNSYHKYATIVAIVGMKQLSSSSSSTDDSIFSTYYSKQRPTTFSMEGMQIRLVAIGRCQVKSIRYQLSSSYIAEHTDDDGHIIMIPEKQSEEDEDDDDDDDDDTIASTHDYQLLVGEYQMIMDTLQKSTTTGTFMSPIHAINEMSTLAQRIHDVHMERISLVNGIKAGQARLLYQNFKQGQQQMQQQAQQQQQQQNHEKLQLVSMDMDHDGIGSLFFTDEEMQLMLQQQQQQQQRQQSISTNDDGDDTKMMMPATTTTGSILSDPDKYTNYGMGNTATSISSIHDVTKMKLRDIMTPYYTPERIHSEEYYYELYSYITLESCYETIDHEHIRYSIYQCHNTIERFHHLIMWLQHHCDALKKEAYLISQQLLDCGEECQDLW